MFLTWKLKYALSLQLCTKISTLKRWHFYCSNEKLEFLSLKTSWLLQKQNKKINPALWGKTDYKNANSISKIGDPTGIFLHNESKSILSLNKDVFFTRSEKFKWLELKKVWWKCKDGLISESHFDYINKKMCQSTILSIFSLGAQDND